MRLNTLHYVLIGTIIGMALVFGLFAFFRNKMTPTDVPEIQTAVNTAPENAERCPVCQKPVNPASDFCMTVGPKKYNFCSDICFRSFKDDPFLYIKDDIKLNIEIIPVEQNQPQAPAQPNYERVPDNPPPVENKPVTPAPKQIPEASSGNSESNLIENIPLPDDITSSQGSSSGSNEIEEIPLDSGNSNPPPAPPAPKQNTQNSEIEELMLDTPDTQTQQAPAPPPAQQTKTQTDGNMVIEEIPLN